ncbi:MAG: TraB/GumN family protein [Steroidobacteraceae bacterium]
MSARLLAATLCWAVAAAALADSGHHSFWSVKGAHNTVYLLGSVHVLKPADSDLPPDSLRAYNNAKALVMELDLNNISADSLVGADLSDEMLPEGQTLAEALGPSAYGKFAAHLQPLGVEPDFFSQFQPWFAAISLEQLELARLGFETGSGVDEQFAARAQSDHKPIIALETIEQQLGIFAHLSLDEQRRFMLYTLEDADDTSNATDAVISAWRNGDTKSLEQLLSESYAQYPELFRMLTTDRNRAWLPVITGLLHEDQDYLVIVGALHLVGKDGIIQLLAQQGYQAIQH